jgi:chromosome segregation ATPase
MDAVNNCYLIQTDDGYLLFCERQLLTESRALEQMGSMNDELINLQRESVKKNHQLEKLRRELDERVAELEATLARVNQLEGIIPICSYCKKIRDDQNGWQPLETYISDHSEVLFSHGACPDCLAEQMEMIGDM